MIISVQTRYLLLVLLYIGLYIDSLLENKIKTSFISFPIEIFNACIGQGDVHPKAENLRQQLLLHKDEAPAEPTCVPLLCGSDYSGHRTRPPSPLWYALHFHFPVCLPSRAVHYELNLWGVNATPPPLPCNHTPRTLHQHTERQGSCRVWLGRF